jgi:hypothetical protein
LIVHRRARLITVHYKHLISEVFQEVSSAHFSVLEPVFLGVISLPLPAASLLPFACQMQKLGTAKILLPPTSTGGQQAPPASPIFAFLAAWLFD